MKIFAIADLHLSTNGAKPMDIFGAAWEKHAERIAENWRAMVAEEDIVLIAGDISWALKLTDALADLAWLAELPGRKVFIKGNHDYWWSSISKVREAVPAGMYFIQNDAVSLDGIAVAGSRMWDFPGIAWPPDALAKSSAADAAPRVQISKEERAASEAENQKIRQRELQRLRLSLSCLSKDAELRIAMLHYPPLSASGETSDLTDLLAEYDLDYCLYGHVHSLGDAPRPGADCSLGKTRYLLTACDWLHCQPLLLQEIHAG